MSVEVLINDRFFDPDNCTPAERNAVRDYLVREFLVMANRKGNKPEDKLRKLNSYLHSNFPECFELLNI